MPTHKANTTALTSLWMRIGFYPREIRFQVRRSEERRKTPLNCLLNHEAKGSAQPMTEASRLCDKSKRSRFVSRAGGGSVRIYRTTMRDAEHAARWLFFARHSRGRRN